MQVMGLIAVPGGVEELRFGQAESTPPYLNIQVYYFHGVHVEQGGFHRRYLQNC